MLAFAYRFILKISNSYSFLQENWCKFETIQAKTSVIIADYDDIWR